MQLVEIEVFNYQELSERAKEKARQWFTEHDDYYEFSDCMESVKKFCDHFGATNLDYSIGAFCHSYLTADTTNESFRNMKLSDFKPDYEPTGYWLDYSLWGRFYEEFKATGNAKGAFYTALDSGLKAIQMDMEYRYEQEYIEEVIELNEYRFREDGTLFTG